MYHQRRKFTALFTVLILLYSVFILNITFAAAEEAPEIEWKRSFGNRYDNDRAYSVQQTTDGGYIIAGYTESYGAGGKDVYLIKTNASGEKEWEKTFGGSKNDEAYSVQQTADGGYIIAGYTESYGAGNKDVYLIKTNASGEKEWEKTFGDSKDDYAKSVQQTTDGGYIIAGYVESRTKVRVGVYETRRYIFLIKTNASGEKEWEKTFESSKGDMAYSVQQATDGGYIIAGQTIRTHDGLIAADAYLVKTDASGEKEWDATFDQGNNDYAYSVQQTTDGGYIIAGRTEYHSYFHRTPDVYLVKTDANGKKEWVKIFSIGDYDYAYSVQQTTDGGYIIAGYSGSNAFLVKTNASGGKEWEKTFRYGYGVVIYSIQQTTDGGYIVAGFENSYKIDYITYRSDVFLAKFDGMAKSISIEPTSVNIIAADQLETNLEEDFEDTQYEFNFTGNWRRTSIQKYEGNYSYTNADISDRQTSSTQFTVNIPAGATDARLSFKYKVSSENSYDFLNIYVDGVRKVHVSGNTNWQEYSQSLSPGEHTIKFEYRKDGSVSRYDDAGYIDDIKITGIAEPLGDESVQQLTVTAIFEDGSIRDVTASASYEVADNTIARVENGLVFGLSPGNTTITVSYDGKTATVPVTVRPSQAQIESITVSPDRINLMVNETCQLTVTDNNGNDLTSEVTYTSDNESVAIVSSDGLVTAIGSGEATITVTYNNLTAVVPVAVYEITMEILPQGDIITLKVPQHLQSVTYNCSAGFTVTENGINVPVTKVEVKDGTDGWPYSEVWLYLEHPVTMGSDVVVEYNADPDYPITPVDGGSVNLPLGTQIENNSEVPLTVDRSTVIVGESGDVVHIDLPTAIRHIDYNDDAGFRVVSGGVNIPVTRVVTDSSGTRLNLYLDYPVPAREVVTIDYTPDPNYEITTVSGTPLSSTTEAVVVDENNSTSPVVVSGTPVVSEDGRTITIPVPGDLQEVYYEGNTGFRVFVNGQEIPVTSVEVQDNRIILTLGIPIFGNPVIDYTPVDGQPIQTENGTPLNDMDGVMGNNQSEVTIESLVVKPNSVVLEEGNTVQFTVMAYYSDGTSTAVTDFVNYESADGSIVQVSESGLVTGVTPGNTSVTVTYQGQTTVVPVTVNASAPVLENITVSLEVINIPAGISQQITVTAHYSDGTSQDVTAQAEYSSSNQSVAMVSNNGLVNGISEGSTSITVEYDGKTLTVPVNVTAPILENISVQPAQVSLMVGKNQQITVTAHYSDGTSQDITAQAEYSSNNQSVAMVDNNGLISGMGEGSTSVTVEYNGKAFTVPVNVIAPVTESISVTPNVVNVIAGKTQQLTVTANMSDGSTKDVTSEASYSSGDAAKVTVTSNGLITGITPGSTVVTVSYQGKTVDVPVIVTAPILESISVQPAQVSIMTGESQQLTVMAYYSNDSSKDVTSDAFYQANSNIISVQDGLVEGLRPGNTSVRVIYQGQSVTVPVTVIESVPVIEYITVTPETITLRAAEQVQLTVTAHKSDGSTENVTGAANYSSGNPAVATVTGSGLVTGESTGSTDITVSYEGKTATVTVSVTQMPVGVIVRPESLNLQLNSQQMIKVFVEYSDSSTVDVTNQASFMSNNNMVATVTDYGLVKGRTYGSATITVVYNGETYTVPVRVSPITITPPANSTRNPIIINRPENNSSRSSINIISRDDSNTGSNPIVITNPGTSNSNRSSISITPRGGNNRSNNPIIITNPGNSGSSNNSSPIVISPPSGGGSTSSPITISPSRPSGGSTIPISPPSNSGIGNIISIN